MIPLFADAHHRRDYDALIEKLWRARVRLNEQRREQAWVDAKRSRSTAEPGTLGVFVANYLTEHKS